MKSDQYFVQIQHRPRRVAFLVDAEQCTETLFNEIVTFNVMSWGGRHNPIIPVVNGTITDPYWELLGVIDPDILYAYCDLPPALSQRISLDIRPLDVGKHNPRFAGHQNFRPGVRDQASVVPALRSSIDRVPFFLRNPEPAVILFEDKTADGPSTFSLRNFGWAPQLNIWCRNYNIPSVAVPKNDATIAEALARNRHLILPIDICADAPLKLRAVADDWNIALTIWFGDSPWNFIEYWNSAYFRGTPSSGLSSLWVPTGILDDPAFYQSVIQMLRTRVFLHDHSSSLRIVSYDQSPELLTQLTKQVVADFKWNLHFSEPIVREKGTLPKFKVMAGHVGLFGDRTRARHEQVSGESAFIDVVPPVNLPDRNERWIAEFAVEDPQQERYFANKTSWWKLPRKNRVANLLLPHSPCRVGLDHSVAAEVSGAQQGVLLKIPDLWALFRVLLVGSGVPPWMTAFNSAAITDSVSNFVVRSSDKGHYARGVLGLFGSLQKTGYVFEHRFWGKVIESLATPNASLKTTSKVLSDLQRMELDLLTPSERLETLSDEIIDVAGRMQRPEPYITFANLFASYYAFIQSLLPEERLSEIEAERDVTEDRKIREAARQHLRRLLSELTKTKLFFHGAEVQCRGCLTRLWYHIDELHSVVICRGCRQEIHLPAEIQWSYALNELVATAVRDHGVAPVIRTALRLFKESRECFYFLPGLELRDYSSGSEKQVCEFDLVWNRDGEFGVAEVKRTAKKFDVSTKLAKILSEILPGKVLLASPAGEADEMANIRTRFSSRISSRVIVEAWGKEEFDRPSDLGWNTSRHSIFG